MLRVTLPCPHPGCGLDLDVICTYEGGDWVPYGSTTVQLPGGWYTETEGLIGHPHPPLSDAEYDALCQRAVDQVADQEPEGPEPEYEADEDE